MNNHILCMITATLLNKTIINSLTVKAIHSDWVSVDERLVHVSSKSMCVLFMFLVSKLCVTDLTIVLNKPCVSSQR